MGWGLCCASSQPDAEVLHPDSKGVGDFPAGGPFTASPNRVPSSVFWGAGCSLGTGWDGGLGTRRWPPGDARVGPAVAAGSNSRSALRLVPRAEAGGLPGREWAGFGGCAFLQAVVPGVAEVGDSHLHAEWQSWLSRRALLFPRAIGPKAPELPESSSYPHLAAGLTICISLCSRLFGACPLRAICSICPVSLAPAVPSRLVLLLKLALLSRETAYHPKTPTHPSKPYANVSTPEKPPRMLGSAPK